MGALTIAGVGVWLFVRGYLDDRRDGDRGELAVEDRGPGFPPGLVGTAFERFTQGDTSRTGQGTGIGLAIVASIVEALGGEVGVRDAAPGACVVVRLPLA